MRFIEGMKLYGRGWSKVAQVVGTRTTIQVRSHAQKYEMKEARRFRAELAEIAKDYPGRNRGNAAFINQFPHALGHAPQAHRLHPTPQEVCGRTCGGGVWGLALLFLGPPLPQEPFCRTAAFSSRCFVAAVVWVWAQESWVTLPPHFADVEHAYEALVMLPSSCESLREADKEYVRQLVQAAEARMPLNMSQLM